MYSPLNADAKGTRLGSTCIFGGLSGMKREESEIKKGREGGSVMESTGEFWDVSKTFIIFDVDFQKPLSCPYHYLSPLLSSPPLINERGSNGGISLSSIALVVLSTLQAGTAPGHGARPDAPSAALL